MEQEVVKFHIVYKRVYMDLDFPVSSVFSKNINII